MKYLTVFLSMLIALDVWACRCVPPKIEDRVTNSKYVFWARIYLVEDVAKLPNTRKDVVGVRAKFEVREAIKGQPEQLDYIFSGYGDGDCGLKLTVGEEYLFFTNNGSVSSCDGNIRNFSPQHSKGKYIYEKIIGIVNKEKKS